MVYQKQFVIETAGRGTINIGQQVDEVISSSEIQQGLCHVFVHHTSASLMICENADPTVRADLEAFMQRLVPDGDELFAHVDEGPDDMSAHVRSVLTHADLTLPIVRGRCSLGTWQGIYLWEHRTMGYKRHLTITLYGDR